MPNISCSMITVALYIISAFVIIVPVIFGLMLAGAIGMWALTILVSCMELITKPLTRWLEHLKKCSR